MTTESAIDAVVAAIKAGIHEPLIKWSLMNEKFSPERAETIIRWAKQLIKGT
jgi:hypothetical protein